MRTVKEIKKELDARNDAHFKVLIPAMGSAGTIEGEMLRAINKIIYRYYNDGDYFWMGYGCETAGPAHAFLMSDEIPGAVREDLRTEMGFANYSYGDSYDNALYNVLETILNYIDSLAGNYTESDVDMYSFEAWWHEEEDEDDFCWCCGDRECSCGSYDDDEE